jgi:hypothetical protein
VLGFFGGREQHFAFGTRLSSGRLWCPRRDFYLFKLKSRLCGGVVQLCLLLVAVSMGAQSVSPELMNGLKWRLIGPFRGGRAVAVAGVPGDSTTFYFGAVNGGIWKTTDAGVVWTPVFDKQAIGAIGAIAVAPSDPKTIYAGTGESDIRSDLSSGNGVYKSIDGGVTWLHIGLEDTRQISRIVVDPQNANVVYVGALGHAYGLQVCGRRSALGAGSRAGSGNRRFRSGDLFGESAGVVCRDVAYSSPAVEHLCSDRRTWRRDLPLARCGEDLVAPQRQRAAGRRLGTGWG